MGKAMIVVTVFNIESGSPEVEATLRFAGDCLASPREQAEQVLRNMDFVPLDVAGEEWEELGVGSRQATLREEPT